MRVLTAIVLLYVVASAPAAAQDAPAEPGPGVADAFMDEAARELVRLARLRRGAVDMRISAYETRALERMSARMTTPLGDRLLFRRETASDISWTRDSVHIHVVGAREVMPVARSAPQIPQDLTSYMPSLAFDPVSSDMLLSLEGSSLRHPLAEGSEEHYRFATGDSTVITLPDGRTVRLRELRVVPRRSDPRLISGSLWLEATTHAVVQSYFRLARAVDTSGEGAGRLFPVRAELDYIALDYGLWDLQWWLPRTVTAQGVVHFAGRRLPLNFERRYTDYTVTGDPTPLPLLATGESATERLCRPRTSMSILLQPGSTPLDTMAAETAALVEARQDSVRRARRAAAGDTAAVCDRTFVVSREDHPVLLASAAVSSDIYAGESLIEPGELEAIAERMRLIPTAPWQLATPRLEWPLNRPGLVRYNRVEGLSLGARAVLDMGGASADASLRVGTASGEVGAELGASRSGNRLHYRFAGYRRLDVVDVAIDPFGMRSTLSALVLGRDDNDYFRATGAELRVRPPDVRPQWYDLRLFAERQQAAAAESDFSVARLIDSDRDMRPNIAADAADQAGATLRLRTAAGLDPDAFRWGTELELHGETGDYTFVRPALRLRASAPLFGRLSLGAEGAVGSSFGDAPLQRHWQLGGASTLRGYAAATVRGESFWHARTELGYGMPFARLILFNDAGWAGPRDGLLTARTLTSQGVGISALDGLLRLDVARGRQTGSWRLHLHLNGIM